LCCPADDSVCCDADCGAECYSCLAAKTAGPDGTCSLVTDGTNPDEECAGFKTCQSGSCSN